MTQRVLAVEDSPTQGEALRSLLASAGYDVVLATSGEEAIDIIASDAESFDLVVSDVVMPGSIDGYELCRQIKASSKRHLPVVLLTSLADPMDIINGLECGADNFITKPYDGEHLLERLSGLLETKHVRRESKLRMGVQVFFMGRQFTISSDREQILDLLISTFEDAVHQNRVLRTREHELEAARADLAEYAGSLRSELDRFFHLTDDLICVASKDGYFTRLNPAWEQVLGWTTEELMSRPATDFCHPGERAGAMADLGASQQSNDQRSTEYRFLHKDGSYRWLEWRTTAVPDTAMIFAVARDVTDRVNSREILEIRARQQAAVASLGQAALQEHDVNALSQRACEQVAETLGIERAEVMQVQDDECTFKRKASVGWPIGENIDCRNTRAGEALSSSQPVVVEDYRTETRGFDQNLLRDQGIMSGFSVVIPVASGAFGVLGIDSLRPRTFSRDDIHFLQAIAHILGTAIDRDRTDHAMRRTQRMESVGHLAAGVAHDFNNLLTVIFGETELAQSELPDDHPVRGPMEEVRSAATRAAALTRQLLAFSKQEVVDPVVLIPNQVVGDTDSMLRRLIGGDIEQVLDLEPELGAVRIDRVQLEQVLMNLVVNARDAMPDGGKLTIATRNQTVEAASHLASNELKPDDYVVLTVADTGTGMPVEVQHHAFEPFYTTKAEGKGTGLGLATCYGIIHQAGGLITLDSTVGEGTTFTVYLPRVHDAVDPVKSWSPPALGKGSESILLVEDDDAVRRIALRILQSQGYIVTAVGDPHEALQQIEEPGFHTDLLLTDLVMPGMNGRMLAERAREKRSGLKVLYMSGYTRDDTLRQNLLEHRDMLISKPFTIESLSIKVREALDGTLPS